MGLCLFPCRYPIKERGRDFCPHSRLPEKLYIKKFRGEE